MRTVCRCLMLACLLVCAHVAHAQGVRFDLPLVEGTSARYAIESERSYELDAPFFPGGGQSERWAVRIDLTLAIEGVDGDGARLRLTIDALSVETESSLNGSSSFHGRAGEEADVTLGSRNDQLLARALAPSLGEEFIISVDDQRRLTVVRTPEGATRGLTPEEMNFFEQLLGADRLRESLQSIVRPLGAPDRVERGDDWSHAFDQRTSLASLRFTSEHRVERVDDTEAIFDMRGTIDIDAEGMGRDLSVEREVYEGSIAWDMGARMAREAMSRVDLRYTLSEKPRMKAAITGSQRVVRLDGDAPGEASVDLSALLTRARARFEQPAIAAAIVSSERVLGIGVAGTRVAGVDLPVTLDDRWHLGSCTKAMSAALLAIALEGDDDLSLDSTLSEVFPELGDRMHPRYRRATLRDVTAHSAGLPEMTNGLAPDRAALADLPEDPRAARRVFAERLLTATNQAAYAPSGNAGEMRYSNAGYGLIGAIAERLLDDDWEDLMRERVFEPVGMEHAGFGWPALVGDAAEQPRGHTWTLVRQEAQALDNPYQLESGIDPAGDVHASIGDWARFAQDRLRALRGGASPVLGPDTTRELMTPLEGEGYSGGWGAGRLGASRLFAHDGSAGTFYCTIWILPEDDRAVMVVTNSGNGAEACAAVRGRLLEEFRAE